MTIQERFIPTPGEASKWEAFALLAHQIGTCQSQDYRGLCALGAELASATVFGLHTPENPCVRLRTVARKAAYAPRPHEFNDTIRSCAKFILFAYGEAFGGEHYAGPQ